MKIDLCDNNKVAFWLLIAAIALMAFLFLESRNDPSLRIAALVSGTGLVSALSSIASTMLTGKDVNAKGSSVEIPPGASVSAQIQAPSTGTDPKA